jgi:hypothetical protein
VTTDGSAERLHELLAGAAAAIPGTVVTAAGGSMSWALGPTVFAVLAGEVAEFRLDPVVAAAARRTPETASSERGGDWVAFRPSTLDQYAEDRAQAWFAAAARRAVLG